MHEYDITLKLLLRGSAGMAFQALTGGLVERWLDIELPKMQNPRMDLLGEFTDGGLLHLELQSGNDSEMPLRMAEYALGVYRRFNRFPRQIVLYVGEPVLRMQPGLTGARFSFSYELRDLRDLDGDGLLSSPEVGDNVLAVLARLRDRKSAVTEIVRRIAELDPVKRDAALGQLIVLAGLRGLEETVEEEIRKMPILNDIMDHKVLGREYKRGRAEGIADGRQDGIQQGELRILRRLLEKRFGPIPAWAEERLDGRSAEDLEALSIGLLESQSLEELLA
jgi:predicted transposase YdaD